MKIAIVAMAVGALVALVWLVARRRARARQWIERLASTFGIRRLAAETDEELRERCRRVVAAPATGTRDHVQHLVRDALWGHGYRRANVVVEPGEPGTIRVRVVSPPVPDGVLRVVERELSDAIPVWAMLELSAPPQSREAK